MDIISQDVLTDLSKNCTGKAISIYMQTFATGRESRQNPIRLKNLVDTAENILIEGDMGEAEARDYLADLIDLIENESFWNTQDEGLALFLDENALRIFRVPQRFEPLAVVGDAFHITPLVPMYNGNGQYFLLALHKEQPRLYQGSRYQLAAVEGLDLPEGLQEMLDAYYEFHQHMQMHNKTVTPDPALADAREGTFFGHGGEEDDEKAEIQTFFHRFDAALMDYLDGATIPLVLAGVAYLHPLYREANSYPNLIEDGIMKDVDQMPLEDLHEQAWELVEDRYQTDVEKAQGVYAQLAADDGDVSDDIEDIVSAAHFKRVDVLFLAEQAHIWGHFNAEKNEVVFDDSQTSENEDLLSEAAAHTLINGGKVLVLPKGDMPNETEAAAILRF